MSKNKIRLRHLRRGGEARWGYLWGALLLVGCQGDFIGKLAEALVLGILIGAAVGGFGLGSLICLLLHGYVAMTVAPLTYNKGFWRIAFTWWLLSAAGVVVVVMLMGMAKGAAGLLLLLLGPLATVLLGALAAYSGRQLEQLAALEEAEASALVQKIKHLNMSLLAVPFGLVLLGGVSGGVARHQRSQEVAVQAERARREYETSKAEIQARFEREAARRKEIEAEASARDARRALCRRWMMALDSMPGERAALLDGSLSFGNAEENALAIRVTQRELTPGDVGPNSPEIPCLSSDPKLQRDTYHDRIRRAYGRALLSPSLWTQGQEPSPLATEALRHLGAVEKPVLTRFHQQIDRLAQTARTEEERRIARLRCEMASELSDARRVRRPGCKALGRLAGLRRGPGGVRG